MKKVLIAGGCFIAGGILVVAVLILNFGAVIKTAVNFFGPEVIHTGVGVEDVDASIFSARSRLTNFFVVNPDGFTSPRARQVKSVRLDVDGSSPELTAKFASPLKALGVAFDGRNIKDRIRQSRDDLEGVKSELKDMGGGLKGFSRDSGRSVVARSVSVRTRRPDRFAGVIPPQVTLILPLSRLMVLST